MKIKELLSDETKWTQGSYARDGNGEATNPVGPNAVCWCLLGASMKCYGEKSHEIGEIMRRELRSETVSTFNDSNLTNFQTIKKFVEKLDL